MDIDFIEIKKIYDVVNEASDKYEMNVFKPWESSSGKNYITIQLVKKE